LSTFDARFGFPMRSKERINFCTPPVASGTLETLTVHRPYRRLSESLLEKMLFGSEGDLGSRFVPNQTLIRWASLSSWLGGSWDHGADSMSGATGSGCSGGAAAHSAILDNDSEATGDIAV